MLPPPSSALDRVLTLQLGVAWAGEALCEPVRLGWWKTDLIDEAGGGDLLSRLLPRTFAWAGLEAVREAARLVDSRLRRSLADPDRVISLFHFGFELDELLKHRLEALKRSESPPPLALPDLSLLSSPFDRSVFAAWLTASGTEDARVVPGGRELHGPPPSAVDRAASRLAAALVPFPSAYPLPFFRKPR
ncbi:MAG: BREX-6 system BrxE protein [Myxococcales bacterium]|nr:BREX-6 system BrxE protein [Myxococcales bacterium]